MKKNNILPIISFIDYDFHLGLVTSAENLLEVFESVYLVTGDRTCYGRQQDAKLLSKFARWALELDIEYGMFQIKPIEPILPTNRFAWDALAWSEGIKQNPGYEGYLLMSGHDIIRLDLFRNRLEQGWVAGDQKFGIEDLDAALFASCRRYGDKDIASIDFFPGPLYFKIEKNSEWEKYLTSSKNKLQFLSCLAGNKVSLSSCPKTGLPMFDSLEFVGPPSHVCDRCRLNLPMNLYYEMSVESIDGRIVGTDIFGNNRYTYSAIELKNTSPEYYRRNYVS